MLIIYSKWLYPHAAGASVLAFFGETSVEWLQGGSVLMGVGMASIFATGKPHGSRHGLYFCHR
jgi:hypothetical protein